MKNLFLSLALILAGLLPLEGAAQSNAASNAAKLRDVVVVTDPIFAGGAKCDGTTNDSTAIQAALNTGKDVDLRGLSCRATALTMSTNQQALVSTTGTANLIKAANGTLLTVSGDDAHIWNITFRGGASSAEFTGDNVVITGQRPTLINSGSIHATGRALLATGGRVVVRGSNPHWATTDATATGYDIEIGASGTATLYHHLEDIYTSQPTGGILATDTGALTIIGGQYGKMNSAAGTSPAGSGTTKVIGSRILGDITVGLSNSILSANAIGAVAVTFGAGTSGSRFDLSNILSTGATITNLGNANNNIMREVSTGSVNQIKFGPDSAFGIMQVSPSSPGQFTFTQANVPNNRGYRMEQASGADGGGMSMSTADNLAISNAVTNKALQLAVTGTTSGSVIQQIVGGSSKTQTGAGGFHRINSVSADKGDNAATLAPSSSEPTNIWNSPISADRAVTLSTTNALNGMKFRIVRTAAATGAFNLNVGTGPLKALTAGQWCDVEYNGSAWMLTAFGSL